MNLIFGCGSNGHAFLEKTNIKINYFSDNNPHLWNKYIGKIKIINPNEILKKKIKNIIICSPGYPEILKNLRKKKFKGKISIYRSFKEKNGKLEKFLITSHSQNGGIFELNLKNEKFKKLVSGKYRGIKKIENQYLAVNENKGLVLLNKNFKKLKILKLPKWHNAHSVAYNNKSKIIYLAVTGFDQIYCIRYPSLEIKKIIDFSKKKLIVDSFHLNGLLYLKNKLYVSMFSKKGTWKNNKWNDGTIGYYKIPNFEKFYAVKTKLKQPHSLTNFRNEIYYCNSIDYEIKSLKNFNFKLNGYTRGLYIDNNILLVGYSKSRNLDRFLKNNSFKNNFCSVNVFDKQNNTYKIIPSKIDQIFDIIKK